MSQAVGNCMASTWSALSSASSTALQWSGELATTVIVNAKAAAAFAWQGAGSVFSFAGATLSSVAASIGSVAARVAALAQPVIATAGAFIAANSGTIAIGTACAVGGALLYAAFQTWNAAPAQVQPAAAPVADPAAV